MFKVAKTHEKDPIEMRAAYAETLIELAETNKDICVLEADLSGSVGTKKFKEKYPDRYINVGIAEQSLACVAAGMSVVGRIPFAHTFACFASRRACDQNYISVAYAQTNAKIVGSDPGIVSAQNGGTHQALEDINIMRAIPNMTIIEPSDRVMLKWAIKKAAATYGPFYIRLQRADNIIVYEEGSEFELGKANIIKDGTDVTLIGLGSTMIEECYKAAELLEKDGISTRIVDMFTVKPLDVDCILKCANETGAIVTVENHTIIGGLGSAVAEVLAENGAYVPFSRIGIRDRVGEVGTVAELKVVMKMTKEDIAAAAKEAVSKKK